MVRWIIVALFMTTSGAAFGQVPKQDSPWSFPDIEETIKKLAPNLRAEQAAGLRKTLEMAKMRVDQAKAQTALLKKLFDNDRDLIEQLKSKDEEFFNTKERMEKAMGVAQRKIGILETELGKLDAGFETNIHRRLGARLYKPNAVLIAQLGLQDGKGLVFTGVVEDSVAAKAGFKANDILLKLGGKDVPSDAIDFTRLLNAIKKDTPIEAVVLRNGKQQTIRKIKLQQPDN